MREGDTVTAADKELWEYFSTLYKNSNKGIKGRGKDRRISTVAREGEVDQPDGDDHSMSSSSSTWGQMDTSSRVCRERDHRSSDSIPSIN